jgi:hypothetical protein
MTGLTATRIVSCAGPERDRVIGAVVLAGGELM